MRILALIAIAVRSLRRAKLRTSLATMGVVVGVAAVVAMVSLGEGAKEKVERTFGELVQDNLVVSAASHPARDGSSAPIRKGAGLTLEDFREIRREVRSVSMATAWVFSPSVQVKVGRRALRAAVIGHHGEPWYGLNGRVVLKGSFFRQIDIQRSTAVCMVTESVERGLFEGRAVGRTLLLGGVPFEVLGVVEDSKSAQETKMQNGDLTVFVPITSWLQRFDANAQIYFALRATQRDDTEQVAYDVRDVLEKRRGTRRIEFQVQRLGSGLRQITEGARTMTLLLSAIAGVSLVVGGIGIMNVMFATVTERTREIGIRLAVGTATKNVLKQFTIEAVLISTLGGLLGILLGVACAHLLTQMNDWPTRVSMSAVFTAFICSASIGILFGYFPALRAANLSPVFALRAD